jgi:hypothetical protein
MRKLRFVVVLIGLVWLLPQAAVAAPDRSMSLSAAQPSAAWSTETGVGTYTGAAYDLVTRCAEAVNGCDRTLLNVTVKGDLTLRAATRGAASNAPYVNYLKVNLYRSDAAGTQGTLVAWTGVWGPGVAEMVVPRLAAGRYLAEVEFEQGVMSADVTAHLVPAPPEDED